MVVSEDIHGANVQRTIKGRRITEIKFCREMIALVPGFNEFPILGIKVVKWMVEGLFRPDRVARQVNTKEKTIKGWIINPVR